MCIDQVNIGMKKWMENSRKCLNGVLIKGISV